MPGDDMNQPQEVWNVRQSVEDMLEFCIHTRLRTEMMEKELRLILEELNDTNEVE
jgi:hypothetical protein